MTVGNSVFSGTCHSILFLCHLPAPNNIQQCAEAGLAVPLLLLSLGPLLAPWGHTSTSLVVNAGVEGRYQLKSVTLWPGVIWTRAVELRVREGLEWGSFSHLIMDKNDVHVSLCVSLCLAETGGLCVSNVYPHGGICATLLEACDRVEYLPAGSWWASHSCQCWVASGNPSHGPYCRL